MSTSMRNFAGAGLAMSAFFLQMLLIEVKMHLN